MTWGCWTGPSRKRRWNSRCALWIQQGGLLDISFTNNFIYFVSSASIGKAAADAARGSLSLQSVPMTMEIVLGSGVIE